MHHLVFQHLHSILYNYIRQNNPKSPFNQFPTPFKTKSCTHFTNKLPIQSSTDYQSQIKNSKKVKSLPKIRTIEVSDILNKYKGEGNRQYRKSRKRDVDSLYQFNRQNLRHCISNNQVKSHPDFNRDCSLGGNEKKRQSTRIYESCVFCGCSPCDQRLVCAHASHLSCFLKSPKIPRCQKCESKNNYDKQ